MGATLITSSIYHYCVVRQKESSRKVGMSKVESFYWNKLSRKSCSFGSEQFFDLCFVSVVLGSTLITYCIFDYCVVRHKEFSRKVGMSKVECFYWNRFSSKSFFYESEQFVDLHFVLAVQGAALITSSIYHCCVIRQKEFSRKVEMSKVESFYLNKLSSKNFSFESEQFVDLSFVLAV